MNRTDGGKEMAQKKEQSEEQFSVRIPLELANEVRKAARDEYGPKAGSIKQFVITAFEKELQRITK